METVLEIDDVRDGVTDEPINDAYVEITHFYKASKRKIPGVKWPVVLNYVEGTNGCYRASLPYHIAYDEGEDVEGEIKVMIGDASITIKRDLHIKKHIYVIK